ncbi:MAG: hypothetical protein K2H91_13505 [Lachnospiraceae bacterium]|nr:hypothetical protein [Lachnospiraceae bacterium]
MVGSELCLRYSYYIEGFKIREIAEILELNENTVSTRLAKARKIMEKQYL